MTWRRGESKVIVYREEVSCTGELDRENLKKKKVGHDLQRG